jgi:hypothetical protein
MGHLRLGRLPKTHRWAEVVDLLDLSPRETQAVAAAAVEAADNRFRQLANEPGITYCFWLLTRVMWAARGPFIADLKQLGIDAVPDTSALTLISRISDRVRLEMADLASSGHFSDIASLALRSALSETVAQQGASLFDSIVEDAQRAFRAYSTRETFAELAHRFFAHFMSRSLRSFIDRELANHVGPGHGLANVAESRDFMQALDLHTRQSARIVREFAGAWYSKHQWESKGEITFDEAQRFVGYALRKLRAELKRGAAAP